MTPNLRGVQRTSAGRSWEDGNESVLVIQRGGEVPSLSLVIKVSQLSRVASLGDFVDVAGEVFHCWQVPASAKASMAHLK